MPRLTPFNPPATPDDTLRIWRGPKPSEMPAIRLDKVRQCRDLIAAGGYGTHGCRKLDIAAERLIADAAGVPNLMRLADDGDDLIEHDSNRQA